MKKLLLPILIVFNCFFLRAQDRNFTQYGNLPMELSPSNTGLSPDDVRINMHYRDQWGAVITPFKTTMLSAEYKALRGSLHPGNILGIGLQYVNERAGSIGLNKNDLKLNLAYARSFDAKNRSYLSFGMGVGYVFEHFSADMLVFDNQIENQTINQTLDSREQNLLNGAGYVDVNMGVSFSYSGDKISLIAGVSVAHLNKPNTTLLENGLETLNPLTRYFATFEIPLIQNVDLISGGFHAKQGNFAETQINNSVAFTMPNNNRFRLGVGMRLQSDIALLMGYEWQNLRANLSVDFNTGGLAGPNRVNNSIELGISYAFANPFNPNLRPVLCPKL